MVSLVPAVKAEAQRLGFALAGVTTPDPPPHAATYLEWLSLGRHAHMDYLASERARQRRLQPRLILPECRSILVLAIPYAPARAAQVPPLQGRVAAYAWGEDYHQVLLPRLRALVTFLERELGRSVASRYYTDTGAVLERELAQRAGLGWIGKNSCLINPRFGSYLFLAEIFLDVALPPDEPFTADYCGTCHRCLDACPTACLLPNRTLDARRCISYLTIENREAIPVEIRPCLGNWVFGCDVCQMVCPWNRFAGETVEAAFAPRPEFQQVDLEREMLLTEQEFKRRFKNSPLRRARYAGYLRNIAVALGNSHDRAARAALLAALPTADALVREHILWALEQIEHEP